MGNRYIQVFDLCWIVFAISSLSADSQYVGRTATAALSTDRTRWTAAYRRGPRTADAVAGEYQLDPGSLDVNFAISTYCRAMCQLGRGGNLCKCNAAYFTGKRSSRIALSSGRQRRRQTLGMTTANYIGKNNICCPSSVSSSMLPTIRLNKNKFEKPTTATDVIGRQQTTANVHVDSRPDQHQVSSRHRLVRVRSLTLNVTNVTLSSQPSYMVHNDVTTVTVLSGTRERHKRCTIDDEITHRKTSLTDLNRESSTSHPINISDATTNGDFANDVLIM